MQNMEQRFKSMSIFDFQRKFPDADSCLSHLATLKWSEGYSCPKCGHGSSCEGSSPHSRQCTRCRYVESPTAGTLFHKLKFDPLKAFWIVYFLATNKKGFSSTELARKLELGQKTCWRFKRKVMKAMKSSGNFPITGTAEVDETVFGQQEEGVRGRENARKKLVVVGIEKKGKSVSRLYARAIPHADAACLGGFMKDHIDPAAKVTTDQWTGYGPLAKDFANMVQIPSGKKGDNFPELHRAIMMLKGWLRGMHHHVEDLQDYLDEYCYRFNRNFMKERIFDNLVLRMVKAPPCLIKNISD